MNDMQMRFSCVSVSGMKVSLPHTFFQSNPAPSHLHRHPCYELVCVDDQASVRFIIIPPSVEHVSVDAPMGKVCSLLFSCDDLDENDVCQVLHHIQEPIEIVDTFNGRDCIRAVKEAAEDAHKGAIELMIAELRLFFVKLARSLCAKECPVDKQKQTLDEQRLVILDTYFSNNLYCVNCNKSELADKLGITERHLSRVLYDVYHSNFSTILLRSRMSLARTLLMQGETSLLDIARKVGYSSVRTFKMAYKKFYGSLPEKMTKSDIGQM